MTAGELDPAHGHVLDAGYARVLLDEATVAHHEQR
jgi:hypothetical protein